MGKLLQTLDTELCAKLRVGSDLIVPYPVEKMVRGNRAVYRPSCGVRLSHEVVEVFHQHGIEIVSGYQVEHKAHLSEKADFTLQCKGECDFVSGTFAMSSVRILRGCRREALSLS